MDPITSALSAIGYAADTPGAHLRGALSGRMGERASGQDLLSSYGLSSADDPWGGAKGFATELAVDPLALAGPALGAFKGIRAATRAGSALAHADDANPLLRGLGRFVGEESGALDPKALAERISGDPWFFRSHAQNLTPDKIDAVRYPTSLHNSGMFNVRGIGLHQDPDPLMDWLNYEPSHSEMLVDLRHGEAPGVWEHSHDPAINTSRDAWVSGLDEDELRELWKNTFVENDMRPSLYEAQVEPEGVLDLSYHHPGINKVITDLGHDFGERLWQARQHGAIARGLPWPKVFEGWPDHGYADISRFRNQFDAPFDVFAYLDRSGFRLPDESIDDFAELQQSIENWVRPYAPVATQVLNPISDYTKMNLGVGDADRAWLMSRIGEANHDFHRMAETLPSFARRSSVADPAAFHGMMVKHLPERIDLSRVNDSLRQLREMGADKDLLRHFLGEMGYDSLVRPAHTTSGMQYGGKSGVKGTPWEIHHPGQLNVLDPRIIKSFEQVE